MTLAMAARHLPKRFLRDESGAVTVDWVVMTAAICGIGMLLFTQLTPMIFEQAADVIAADIQNAASRP